ncbi:DUF2182 domain-containing protein [Streptomyces sp. NPDC002643]
MAPQSVVRAWPRWPLAGVRAFWRRPLRTRVSLGFALMAVAAWGVLIALTAVGGPHDDSHAHAASHTTAHLASPVPASPELAMWTLMSVAMMLPAALPAIEHVGVNSLRRRRRHAMATFTAAYLAVWIAYGLLVRALAPLWAPLPGHTVLVAALTLGAAWQLTGHKRRALGDCHRSWPLPLTGRRATAATVRFGLRHGTACLRSCWALMLVMAVAPGGSLLWMAALTGIVTVERLARRPRHMTHLTAALLAATATGVTLATGAAA